MQRLRELERELSQTQEEGFEIFRQFSLGRVLCHAEDEPSWEQAEQIMQSLLKNPSAALAAFSIGAMVAVRRGQWDLAESHAHAVMPAFQAMPATLMEVPAVLVRALVALGRSNEAVAIAEQALSVSSSLECVGFHEVNMRLAASETFQAAGNLDRAHAELREALRQVQLRADDITDPFWKNSYLTRNPYCVRVQQLANEWGLDVVVK